MLGRACDREVVLTRILREKLAELNPGLPDAAYDDAVRQMTALPPCGSRVAKIICSQNQTAKIKRSFAHNTASIGKPDQLPGSNHRQHLKPVVRTTPPANECFPPPRA